MKKIIIVFKTNINAINAVKQSQNSFTEIGAFGDVSTKNKIITVELNDNALKNI